MDVRFVLPELERLDAIRSDALVIAFFSDEMPTKGAFGLVDWRLCGLISRMVVRKRINGSWGETVLLPAYPRLGMDKLILVGLGESGSFHSGLLTEATGHILLTLCRVAARTSAMVLPGRGIECVDPVQAVEALIQVAGQYPDLDEVVVVDSTPAQQAMKPVLDRERRKALSAGE